MKKLILASMLFVFATSAQVFAACPQNEVIEKTDTLSQQMAVYAEKNAGQMVELFKEYNKDILPLLRGTLDNPGADYNADSVCIMLTKWINKTK